MFKRGWIIFALVAWVPVNAAESVRESNRILNDRFTFYLGGFFPQVSSAIRLDADIAGGIGDTISLEDVLGLEDSKSVLWGGFNWRIARRHILELEAFQLACDFRFGKGRPQIGAQDRASPRSRALDVIAEKRSTQCGAVIARRRRHVHRIENPGSFDCRNDAPVLNQSATEAEVG